MTRQEFLRLIEEVIEAEPSALRGDETLESIGWDSLAVLKLLAAVDERYEVVLAPTEIARCKTIDDLAVLMGDLVTT